MAVNPILWLSNESVINTLREVDFVVHQMVPEKYWFSETNKISTHPHPVAMTFGKLLFIDVNPLSKPVCSECGHSECALSEGN